MTPPRTRPRVEPGGDDLAAPAVRRRGDPRSGAPTSERDGGPVGSQAIAVHTGPLTADAEHWAAVFEAGPRAMLDGASALIGSGLQHFTVDRIRCPSPVERGSAGSAVSTSGRHGGGRRITLLRRRSMHQTRGRGRAAALWARTDKQAALVMTMTVQQGSGHPPRPSDRDAADRRVVGGVRARGDPRPDRGSGVAG